MALLFDHEAVTGPVTVRAQPHYSADQSDPAARYWVWHYHVRIENNGAEPLQLIDRHWIVTDGDGATREVRGEGVVGEQPVIQPGESFDYVSACPLPTAAGNLRGSFGMRRDNGERFHVAIPAFDLVAPASAGRKAR